MKNTQLREDLRGNCRACSKLKTELGTGWTLGLRQSSWLPMTDMSEDPWKLGYPKPQSRCSTVPTVCDFLKFRASRVREWPCDRCWAHSSSQGPCDGIGRSLPSSQWVEGGAVNALSSANEDPVRNTNYTWTWAWSKSLESLWHYGWTQSSIMTVISPKFTPLYGKKEQHMWFLLPSPFRLLIKGLKNNLQLTCDDWS